MTLAEDISRAGSFAEEELVGARIAGEISRLMTGERRVPGVGGDLALALVQAVKKGERLEAILEGMRGVPGVAVTRLVRGMVWDRLGIDAELGMPFDRGRGDLLDLMYEVDHEGMATRYGSGGARREP